MVSRETVKLRSRRCSNAGAGRDSHNDPIQISTTASASQGLAPANAMMTPVTKASKTPVLGIGESSTLVL
jgi:hypothetical protein